MYSEHRISKSAGRAITMELSLTNEVGFKMPLIISLARNVRCEGAYLDSGLDIWAKKASIIERSGTISGIAWIA
jgi:hypothetical protein